MTAVSAVIMTFNEEKRIGRCIESVRMIADEIIVVDSYSTDRTEEICSGYGVRFIRHRFEGFVEQRRWACRQVSNDHVLCLDADEEVSSKLQASILAVKQNWEHDAYSFNRLTWYCGKWIRHATWYPSRKLRLVNRTKGRWAGVNPHDRFIPDPGATIRHLEGDLLHYSYGSFSEHMQKVNRFSTQAAESCYKAGRRSGFIRIVIHPLWRFTRDYVFLLGFLDGYHGLVIAVLSARETFLKYVKLRNMYLKNKSSAQGLS